MRSLPNILSISRGIAAVVLMLTTVFSLPFWILYVWCGISDMIDGPLARRLGVASNTGAIIDSIADMVFMTAAIIKIVPALPIPSWSWWIVGILAIVQGARMAFLYLKRGGSEALHDTTNKFVGLALYLAPFAVELFNHINNGTGAVPIQ